jgi:curved DNA-binding protein CbpA
VVRSEPISEVDARAVLGVRPGATEAEIRAAWKKAMGRAHPDQGGTEGLATRVNAARDRLLKKP